VASAHYVPFKVIAILSLVLATPFLLSGQAWLPPRGEGSVGITYLNIATSDHLLSSGLPQDRGPVQQHIVTASVFYGLTDRFAVSAEIPYIDGKFTLTPGLPPNVHDLDSKVDDGRYRGTFQDFRVDLKYNAIRAPLLLTPFFEVVIPSHHYVTFGHSAPGRDLREFHVGTNIGRMLDPVLPRAYFDLRYSYAFVQEVMGISPSRNNVDLEVGYFVTPKIALRTLGAVQKTMAGVESPVPPDSPYFPVHDRLERGHYSRIGGGVTFSVHRNFDLYFLVISTLSGKNIQAFTAPVVGVTWNFRTRKSREIIIPQKASSAFTGRAHLIAE
jgi:hypothetical protein